MMGVVMAMWATGVPACHVEGPAAMRLCWRGYGYVASSVPAGRPTTMRGRTRERALCPRPPVEHVAADAPIAYALARR